MSEISRVLQARYPDAIVHPFSDDWMLQDDGDGPYIKKWNTAKLGPQPGPEQIGEWLAAFVPQPADTRSQHGEKA